MAQATKKLQDLRAAHQQELQQQSAARREEVDTLRDQLTQFERQLQEQSTEHQEVEKTYCCPSRSYSTDGSASSTRGRYC